MINRIRAVMLWTLALGLSLTVRVQTTAELARALPIIGEKNIRFDLRILL